MSKVENFSDKALGIASKVQGNNYLRAISNGLMATLPINILGSISLLLSVLPVPFWQSFVTSIGIKPYLSMGYSVTVGVISVYAAFLIGYQLADNFNQKPLPAGLLSLFSFLVLTPLITVGDVTTLDSSKLGAAGLFAAMISALLFSRLYCFIMEKGIGIKMPESVPQFVSDVFAGLIPVIIAGSLAILLSYLFGMTTYGSFSDFVYTIIATPLTNLSSNVGSMVLIVFIQMFLWFFGIHGSNVVSSFITGLYLPMDVANMDALQAGVANSELPNILGKSFYDLFAGIGGAGGTLSLVIVILVFAKAQQSKAVANLSLVPGFFTINEPMIFGLPLVLNPLMAIPFILTPIAQVLVAYFGISSGLFPRLSGIQVPFGTPIGINGFIAGGWRITLLQILCVLVGCLIYFPFVKMLDKRARLNEIEITE